MLFFPNQNLLFFSLIKLKSWYYLPYNTYIVTKDLVDSLRYF